MKTRHAAMLLAAGLVLQASTTSAEIRAGQAVRPVLPDKALVRAADGRLTANVRDVPLSKVLDEIGAKSGIPVFISARVHKRVTANFRGLPMEEGLRRLLRGTNAAYFFSRESSGDGKNATLKLVRVDVLPGAAEETDIEIADEFGSESADEAASAHLRAQAARTLGKSNDPSAVGRLAETLSGDADPAVRAAAAKALGKTWSQEAVQPLAEAALQDPNAAVREAATRALGETWSDAATDSLVAALAYDRDALVREQAALALGQTAGDEVIEALLRALLEDRRWFVRDGAAAALAAIGSPAALWALEQYAVHDPD